MRLRERASLLSIGAIILVGLFVAGVASAKARNGQIAWKGFPQAGDESTSWIYAANPDGSHLRRLTHPAPGVTDDLPDWSPDGSHLIFERIYQSNTNAPTVGDELMRVDADGTNLRRVGTCTDDCIGNDDPQYSPEGRQIVFIRVLRVKGGSSFAAGVWLMNSDGSQLRQISRTVPGKSEDHEPSWSPDGKHIVFTQIDDTTSRQALFVVARAGDTARRITPWTLNGGGALWSHDGSTILFQSYRDCSCSETSQVYTVRPNGSLLRQLTTVGRNIEPTWSPDGTEILYAHQPGTGPLQLPDLWVMDSRGGDKRPVVQTRLWESEPDWGTAGAIS
jgi:Tol biopolymer transport system component